MKKKLEIVKPPISTFPRLNAKLAIIMAHEEANEWFYNKFVQLYGTMSECFGSHGTFTDAWTDATLCPFINTNVFPREYINKHFGSYIDFVIHCIDSNFYVFSYVDQFYIKEAHSYQKYNYSHPLFIHGYDMKKRVLYGADFFHGIYSVKKLSFDEVEKAYCEYNVGLERQGGLAVLSDVYTYSYRPSVWKFNFDILITSLEDYLYQTDSTGVFYYKYQPEERADFKYGMGYYDILRCLLEEKIWDYRAFHVLCEHLKMMSLRLEFLHTKYGFQNSEAESAYKNMHSDSILLRTLVIKNGMKEQTNSFGRMALLLEKIECCERKVLTQLIVEIKALSSKIRTQ